ncbi:MAG: AAA family ATPase, partial [Candidatus Entotheonellia bacterium]
YISGEHADTMLFEEDITSGPERLKKRLQHIRYNPPIRKGADQDFYHRPETLEQFKKALTIVGRRTAAPSDLQKLRIIEAEVSRETIKLVPLDKASRVLYYGYPGTGKTFRLLQIGMHHALAGRRVLFACFNKVLAADVRRILSFSVKLKESTGVLLPVDVFDVLRTHAEEHAITEIEKDYDEWGALITADMRQKQDSIKTYDTILIDEGQDMKDWALEMLELYAREDTTICVAGGTGQELYGEAGAWLKGFRARSTFSELRRNFRNTRPVFQAAQVFYESRLKPGQIAATVRKFTDKNPKSEQQRFDFAREEGAPPSIVYINEDKLEGMSDTDSSFPSVQFDCMVEEYSRIIKEQLARLAGEERPMDLLVLVPSRDGMERDWVVAALKGSSSSFIDYTDETQRRDIAHPEMVRLCTFHSARGLEGMRVLIFGFERIEGISDQVNADFANLGYIVLSRSLFECVIAVRKMSTSKVVPFLISILDQLPS